MNPETFCKRIYRMKDGDPNGKIIAQAPAILYTNSGGLWVKTNDACDWNGWEEFIAESTE